MQLNIRKFFLLTGILIFSANTFAQTESHKETPYVQGEIMIQFNEGYTIEHLLENVPVWIGLHAKKELSAHMRFWLLGFDHNRITHPELHRLLKAHYTVRLVQNNHYIEERATIPNDPDFNDQWHHVNTGQTGGTADSDIDSDEAWDITTGGLTTLGDTIVVCLVEGGGANYNHVDLIDNFWRNSQEIANNGTDDDGNGYIDDVDGWNVNNNNDNHATGNHGTQCMGMIAAVGNNTVGVSGVNWNVKVMVVSGFGISESSVIAAYDYPLVMRKKYNQTNGAQGAFVVATSASWGIDQADPNDYPLWCAFYDTLGVYGVLNVGATTNSNFNVDVVGDMPTACPSDYMVSVTRTDASDGQAGGYGLTTIDYGAPGINVYTTTGSTAYGTTTGTSFSCPLTAGAIALIYSAPCASLITLAKTNPQAAADQVRLALMNGTDPVASMAGKSVTGGRLNVFNAITDIISNCSASGCITPFAISSFGITDTVANIAWGSAGTPDGYWFYLREQGNTIFDSVYVTNDSIMIDTLSACTVYEFMVLTDCGSGDLSNYSTLQVFQTDGCCEMPSGLTANATNDSTGVFSWSSVLAAQGYNIRFKETGSSTWTVLSGVTSPVTVDTLVNCLTYEVQVQTICDTGTTSFTASVTFSTPGCGACEDLSYCASSGDNDDDEWVAGVSINTLNNTSGANGGYMMFTGITTTLENGNSYPITITPGYSGTSFTEYVKVWIDYNQDGLFTEATELVFSNSNATGAVSGTVNVPATALTGVTRMRVTVKYFGAWDPTIPTSCSNFNYGEVEDYCVTIADTFNTVYESQANLRLALFPNPSTGIVNIQFIGEVNLDGMTVNVVNSVGQIIRTEKITTAKSSLDLTSLSDGIYFIQVRQNGNVIRTGKVLINKN
jgi:serine protease